MDTYAGSHRGPKGVLKRLIPARYHLHLRILFVRFRTLITYPLFQGARYECPFCGRRFRAFLPDGLKLPVFQEKRVVTGGYKANVRCPWCYSSDRDRLLYWYLRERTPVFHQPVTVLHVAPEWHLERVLRQSPNIRYVSGDLHAPSAMVRLELLRLPVRSNSVDVILCNHVLEHVLHDGTAMRELFRVLKPEGWAILQVPIALTLARTYEDPRIISPVDRERAFGQFDHVRVYGSDYRQRLEAAGFVVNTVPYARQMTPERADRYRLNLDEPVFHCHKPL